MPITNVIGVPWNNIISIGGIPKSSITNIGGAVTPPPGPTCTTEYYGYSDGRGGSPSAACTAPLQPYELDGSTGALYVSGGCGVTYANGGYYSDGRTISFFDGSTLQFYDVCPR